MEQAKLDAFKAFVDAQPVVTIPNPNWSFDSVNDRIISAIGETEKVFDIGDWSTLLTDVRTYFRHVYDAFKSEAQVVCIAEKDAEILYELQMPRLPRTYLIQGVSTVVFVLPQKNSFHITNIGEEFWQNKIVANGIHPLARIHSHHILDPYQSPTDYATLNSNTLELVIGHIYAEPLAIGYWLDVRNTLTKENVWEATQSLLDNTFTSRKIPSGNIERFEKMEPGATAQEREK